MVSFFYCYMVDLLPLDRLRENAHWVASLHPRPDYPLHILILPKRDIPSLACAPGHDPSLYADLFLIVQELISDYHLQDSAYRLVTNGGENQSIPIWHWHLICEAFCKGNHHSGVFHD